MLTHKCTCNNRVTTQQLARPLLINRHSPLTTYTSAVSRVPSTLLLCRKRQHFRKVNLPLTIDGKAAAFLSMS